MIFDLFSGKLLDLLVEKDCTLVGGKEIFVYNCVKTLSLMHLALFINYGCFFYLYINEVEGKVSWVDERVEVQASSF